MELLSHISYAIGALSFALRDVFYLRCVAMVSSAVMVTAHLVGGMYAAPAVVWHSLFVLIHGTRVMMMVYGERAARFTAEERELHETLFRSFTKLEFMKLLRAGRWGTAEPGSVLTREGEKVERVLLISHGLAAVHVGGRQVAELRDGQLVGEMSFVTGEPATATVLVREPTRYLAWSQPELRGLLNRNPSMRFAMDQALSREITRKLMTSTQAHARRKKRRGGGADAPPTGTA